MNFKKNISSAFLLCAFLAISVTNISAQSNNSPSLSLDGFDALSVISDIPYLPALVDDLKEDPNSLNPKEEAYFMGELNISPEDFKKKSQAEQDALVEGYVSGKNKETTEFIEDFFAGDKGPAVSASVAPGASNKGFIPYHPLDGVGIAGLTDKATAGNLPSLLNAGYQLLIGIASVLAVVMIFYAGFRYATTVSPGAKTDAKNRILAALGGLLLALSSWLILSTIDADLVGVDLAFQSFEEGKFEFDLLTREAFDQYIDKYKLTITYQEYKTTGSLNGGVSQAGFGGLSGDYSSLGTTGQRHDLKNTFYYVAYEADYSGEPNQTVKKLGGGNFGKISNTFCYNLDIEGTGILRNGLTLNFGGPGSGTQGKCFGSTRHFYIEAGPEAPFGYGNVGSNPLRPFRSAAVSNKAIPKKSILYIPKTKGMPLPGGGVHDGYWVAEDTGSRIVRDNIDLFVGKKSNFSYLQNFGIRGDKKQALEAYIVGSE